MDEGRGCITLASAWATRSRGLRYNLLRDQPSSVTFHGASRRASGYGGVLHEGGWAGEAETRSPPRRVPSASRRGVRLIHPAAFDVSTSPLDDLRRTSFPRFKIL